MERIKYLSNNFIFTNKYFWQNYLQEEVDYIEEKMEYSQLLNVNIQKGLANHCIYSKILIKKVW